jgi:hypothetical protein
VNTRSLRNHRLRVTSDAQRDRQQTIEPVFSVDSVMPLPSARASGDPFDCDIETNFPV